MSAAPKIFNVDKLVPPNRVLVVDGNRHPIRILNVEEFITNLQVAEKLQEQIRTGDAVDLRLSKQIKESCAAIHEAVPTLSLERIGKLRIDQQVAVLEFIRGDLDPNENAPAEAGAATAEGDSAKKPS